MVKPKRKSLVKRCTNLKNSVDKVKHLSVSFFMGILEVRTQKWVRFQIGEYCHLSLPTKRENSKCTDVNKRQTTTKLFNCTQLKSHNDTLFLSMCRGLYKILITTTGWKVCKSNLMLKMNQNISPKQWIEAGVKIAVGYDLFRPILKGCRPNPIWISSDILSNPFVLRA